jgi:hypothetical protein
MKKLVLTGVMLFSVIIFAGAQQSFAWSTVEGGCLTCHTNFASGGGTGHSTHSAASVGCTSCHETPGSVPIDSGKCIVCHPQGNPGQCNLANTTPHASANCLTCHTACAPTTTTIPAGDQASCADWVGDWEFTYDSAMTTKVCFDNSSIDNGTINQLCDNDSAANCVCIDNVTSKQLCVEDIAPYAQCTPDNYSGSGNCVCADNPFYKTPGGPNGKQAVSITQASDNLSFQGHAVPCVAAGTRGTTPVGIVQVDNDTADKLGIAKLSYIVFEGASFDNATFAQILPANFTKDNNSTQFTAETLFNTLGLVSGIKSDNVTPPTCEQKLKVIPGTIFKSWAFVQPFTPFVIIASNDIAFERPISIDWGTDALNDLIHIKIGKRLIFGFGIARPFKLLSGNYTFTVTYGDGDPADTACGTVKVRPGIFQQ